MQHFHSLFEAVESLGHGPEAEAIGLAFFFVPTGADAQLESAATGDIEGAGHVGQHGWMPIQHAGHKHPAAQPLGCLQERSQGDPTLQTILGTVTEERIEMIEGPRRFIQLDVIRTLPNFE